MKKKKTLENLIKIKTVHVSSIILCSICTLQQALFGDIDLSFARYRWHMLAEEKEAFRGVYRRVGYKRGEEYMQKTLLYVGGGVEEKALTLMKASFKDAGTSFGFH